MAISPAGATVWTAINPAFAARLGLGANDNGPFDLADRVDPSRVTAPDGSVVMVNWTVHQDGASTLWVGRERTANVLRELHHRLKNNLQIILSLLSFQAAHLETPELKVPFAQAESRVRAVARLHELAYTSSDLSEVEFGGYLRHLVRALAAGQPLAVTLDAVEVVLSMNQAVPLALISHEFVCSALERSNSTTIHVCLQYEEAGRLSLTIEGDGAGEPGVDLELVSMFVDQLRATLHAHTSPGVQLAVSFPLADN